jgi:hypothetical protein
MKSKSSWWPRAGAVTGLMLLAGSGCMKDFDALSADYGKHGGAGGGSSKAGASGDEDTSGSAGDDGEAGDVGTGGKGGKGGTGGKGGKGGTGGGAIHPGGSGGTAGGPCAPGSAICGAMTECTDLAVGNPDGNSVDNCGTCGTTCSLVNASSATCTAAKCAPKCKTGFDDCNAATKNDGCEADLATPTSCGVCGKVCSPNGTSSVECSEGTCTPTCGDRYADCNSDSDDGCEVYLDKLDACTLTDGCNGDHVACGPLQVCNTGSCVAPQGVAVLSTPLTDTPQKHRFADIFPYPNLEGATLTVRAYAPGATGGTLVMYMSDETSGYSQPYLYTELKTLNDHWVDITIPVASGGNFNAKRVKQINLELWGETGPWLSPATVVYVDSVRTSNQAVNDTFNTSYAPFVQSSLQVVPGSTLGWVDAMP